MVSTGWRRAIQQQIEEWDPGPGEKNGGYSSTLGEGRNETETMYEWHYHFTAIKKKLLK